MIIFSVILIESIFFFPLRSALCSADRSPPFQATFKITLENIPSELTALSNMPISEEKIHGHVKTVHFEESILMSTYLVAVVVGLFDYIEDTTDDGI